MTWEKFKSWIAKNWLNTLQGLILIIGLFFAGVQLNTQNKLLQTTQNQISNANKIASANFTLEMANRINNEKYKDIRITIDNYKTFYPILKTKGAFDGNQLSEYLSEFGLISDLINKGILDEELAWSIFSYDMERAWCNSDIQKYIEDSRKADNLDYYRSFEDVSKDFLLKDKKSCADLDKCGDFNKE